MTLLNSARLGNPVLRQRAVSVERADIGTPELERLIDDMAATMRDSDGVGLAAPQVHVGKRVILVEVSGNNPRYPGRPDVPLRVLINPEVTPLSEEKVEGWEGCLSIPDLRGRVPRYQHIRVSALGRDGQPLEFEADDFFARVLQHEIDHLDGVVFLDRMGDFSTLTHLREFQRFWTAG